jgi:hypothetical protein
VHIIIPHLKLHESPLTYQTYNAVEEAHLLCRCGQVVKFCAMHIGLSIQTVCALPSFCDRQKTTCTFLSVL